MLPIAAVQNRFRRFARGAQTSNGFSGALLELAGDSAQYFVGLVVMGLTNTIVLPLYMRYLSPREFGLYALIEVTALALIAVSGLGFNVSYLKWFAEADDHAVSKLLGTMLVAGGVSATIGGLLLAISARSGIGTRIFGEETQQLAILLIPMVLFETLEALFHTHLRARRRPTAISVASVLRLLGVAVFSIWFIAIQHRGLVGLFGGRILGDVVGLLANVFCCRRDLAVKFSRRLASAMLRYGMPLVTIGLIMLGLDGMGRYLVDHYGTLEQVGLYTAGIKVSNLMRILLVAPLGGAWGGLVFQIAKKPNAQFIYSKLFGYIFLVSGAVAVVLALLTPALFRVFSGPAYRGAAAIVPWLLLVQVASIVQCPASVGIYVSNVTRWLLPIYSVGLGTEFLLGRVLVPRYGMFGAAWAWLFGWSLISLLMIWRGQRHYPLRFEWRPLLLSCVLFCAVPLTRHLALNFDWRSLVLQSVCCFLTVSLVGTYLIRDIRRSRAVFSQSGLENTSLATLAQETS